jgi:hypothetical protein
MLNAPRFESRGNVNVRVLNVRRVKTLLNVRAGFSAQSCVLGGGSPGRYEVITVVTKKKALFLYFTSRTLY